MAKQTTIVRNTSGGQATLVGQRLENGESFLIEHRNILKWRDDLTVSGSILSGDLTVNDGTLDLPTPPAGLNYLLGVEEPEPALVGAGNITIISGTNITTVSGASLDLDDIHHFSFEIIAAGITKEVPFTHQMAVHGDLTIESTGSLLVEGTVALEI